MTFTDPTPAVLGCLLGGACGDALGAPVEFMSRGEILRKHGPAGVTGYLPAYGLPGGAITDDTQMTLFTARGLLAARFEQQDNWRDPDLGVFNYLKSGGLSLQSWLKTQGVKNAAIDAPDVLYTGDELMSHKALFSRRAPGNTCLSSLASQKKATAMAVNNSKGCGAVMRTSPVGIYYHRHPALAFKVAADLGALTHAHTSGYLSGAVLAVMVGHLVAGESILAAVEYAVQELVTWDGHEETMDIIERAVRLSVADIDPVDAIKRLGEGWVGEEALAISIYCALKADSFKEAVLMAVNIDGDSDSTGAITGNICGAFYGIDAIPQAWLNGLELRDVIEGMAFELAGHCYCANIS
ncbi:ADP-ribosylglycohydrolase family protein [Salmonella enterica]|nr:ADP-ribosylglycohydrolase family protein [Salmonella enterica]